MLDVLYDATEIKERDSSPPACEHTHCWAEQRWGRQGPRAGVQRFSKLRATALKRVMLLRGADVFPFAEGDARLAESHFSQLDALFVHHLFDGY